MNAGCVFCEIARGERDAHVVLADELVMAFLDHRPVFKGHVLLAPRAHHETLADLPDPLVAPLFLRARTLAAAVEEGLGADGSFVAINNKVSQSVPHLHVHIVPRRRKDGLRGFFWPRTHYAGDEEMAGYASRLRDALGRTESGARACTRAGRRTGAGPARDRPTFSTGTNPSNPTVGSNCGDPILTPGDARRAEGGEASGTPGEAAGAGARGRPEMPRRFSWPESFESISRRP